MLSKLIKFLFWTGIVLMALGWYLTANETRQEDNANLQFFCDLGYLLIAGALALTLGKAALNVFLPSKSKKSRVDDDSKQSIPVKRKKGDKAGPEISRRADILWLLFTAILAFVLIMAFALGGSSTGYGTMFVAVGIAIAPYLLYRHAKTKQGKSPKRR